MVSPANSNRPSSISSDLDFPLSEVGKSQSDGDLGRRKSLSRRSSLCVHPNLADQIPNLPSPIHEVVPKIWLLPPLKKRLENRIIDTEVVRDRKEYVMWIDLTFRSAEDLEEFEQELKKVRGVFESVNFQSSYRPMNIVYELLPANSSHLDHPCVRITSRDHSWGEVLTLLYECFPGLNNHLDLKIGQILDDMKNQEEQKSDV